MTTMTLNPEELQTILNGPAAGPPPGVVPNFVDPPSLVNGVIITLVLTLSMATTALVMRIYTKLRLIKSLDIEDFVLTLSWAGMVSESVPATIGVNYGAGKHIWDIQLKDFINQLYWVNAVGIAYCPSIVLIKVAILLQYRRIFVPNRQGSLLLYLTLYLTMGVIVTFYIIVMVFNIIECKPREAIWNPLIRAEEAWCFNRDAIFQATGVFNVVSDFAILIIPIPTIWNLQMTRRRKIAVTGLFAIGLLACITSIIRTYYTSLLLNSSDVSWYVGLIGCWTAAEIAVGILICCLPIAPKFFTFLNPKIKVILSSLRKTITFSGSDGSKPVSQESSIRDQAKESSELHSVETGLSSDKPLTDLCNGTSLNKEAAPAKYEAAGSSNWSGRTFLDLHTADTPRATKRDMFETKFRDGF